MVISWIDTHVHLDAAEFDADREAVVSQAQALGVGQCVLPAVDVASFARVRQWAHAYGFAYALGLHPLYVTQATEDDLQQLQAALQRHRHDPHLVAVGEIGLDHFVPGLDRDKQAHFYGQQLRLAQQFDLPVILHVRRAVDPILKGLRQTSVVGGIAHAFNGSVQQAQQLLALGFKLGLGGAVTYDAALQLRRLLQTLPLEAWVMETDAPDIPPQWLYTPAAQRALGHPQGRNDPAQLPRMAALAAQLKACPLQEWAQAMQHNTVQALPRLKQLIHKAIH
jgi:TatD DNase family protein